MAACWHE